MRVIPTTTPDVEQALIAALKVAQSVDVKNVKPEKAKPYKVLVLRADLGQKVTPISRYCRVGIQGWSVSSDGRADLGDAFDITAEAGRQLELLAGTGIVLHAEVESGPVRVADPETRLEYQYLTALLEVSVT